ncbi:MAG: hypothetical protein LBJ00_07595 [Planctomycetaceae bacterium]|jgi:hypothetical protein|nr:hypothetical protein [Planctomycetaceae bacterium]
MGKTCRPYRLRYYFRVYSSNIRVFRVEKSSSQNWLRNRDIAWRLFAFNATLEQTKNQCKMSTRIFFGVRLPFGVCKKLLFVNFGMFGATDLSRVWYKI